MPPVTAAAPMTAEALRKRRLDMRRIVSSPGANSHRNRSRRDEDRRRRARRQRARSRALRVDTPARRLRRHARRRSRALVETLRATRIPNPEIPNPDRSVGVGIPGAISSSTGLVKNANSTWLIGQPLQQDLEARLGRPVRIANDANCFAISEAADGAGAGAEVVFGVIVGTGVRRRGLSLRGQIVDRPEWHRGRVGTQPAAVARADESVQGRCVTAAGADASKRFCRARA